MVDPATVLLGQFVEVLPRLRFLHLLYAFPTHFDEAAGVLPVLAHERHPRVALDVAKLRAMHLGVDQEVTTLGINPLALTYMVTFDRG